MVLSVNTKQIIKGVITIDGHSIERGMSVSELESVLQRKIKKDSDHVGHTFDSITEDGEPVNITVWFEGSIVRMLQLEIGAFRDDDTAYEYLDEWLEKREITEWVGDSYYQTEFGSLTPTLVHRRYDDFSYAIGIELKYGEIPSRKFSPVKENKNNSATFTVNDVKYKIQRITRRDADELTLQLHNWFGNGPTSLDEWEEKHSKDDRKEVLYFNISKIENDKESVIRIADFTYFAIWKLYQEGNLYLTLDNLTEGWGIIGFVIEKYGCGLMRDKKRFTPYLLVFEGIHDEVPYNKDLEAFKENEDCMKSLLQSAMRLTSKYVKIPEEDMTMISLSDEKENLFSYHIKFEDVFINFQRPEKEKVLK